MNAPVTLSQAGSRQSRDLDLKAGHHAEQIPFPQIQGSTLDNGKTQTQIYKREVINKAQEETIRVEQLHRQEKL